MTSDPLLTGYIKCGQHHVPAEGCLRKSQFTVFAEDICKACITWLHQLTSEDLKKIAVKKCPTCCQETIIRTTDKIPICWCCKERL